MQTVIAIINALIWVLTALYGQLCMHILSYKAAGFPSEEENYEVLVIIIITQVLIYGG